ncbi:Uncharacterised protein [Vibrio cholerae]|nr:Uncharacterised protein [Vibrio cholerae]
MVYLPIKPTPSSACHCLLRVCHPSFKSVPLAQLAQVCFPFKAPALTF